MDSKTGKPRWGWWIGAICIVFGGCWPGGCCARRPPLPRGVTWDARSGTFTWWAGRISLPIGFRYDVDPGGDTFTGHFTSADDRVVIYHDIGGYAGAFAGRAGSTYFRETVVDESRVWVARHDGPDGKGGRMERVAVTFPDSGYANFYIEGAAMREFETIEFIAYNLRPVGRHFPAASPRSLLDAQAGASDLRNVVVLSKIYERPQKPAAGACGPHAKWDIDRRKLACRD